MKPLAFISGATGSIGEAIAEQLAGTCRLLLHYHTNSSRAEDLLEKFSQITETTLVQADFKNTEKTLEAFSPYLNDVSIMIHNAGVSRPALFQDTSVQIMQEEMAIGIFSPAALTRKVLPSMISRQEGRIVFITSIWGSAGASMEVVYSTVKSAQQGFVKALAKETAPSGVRVNAVAPGAVKSSMMEMYDSQELKDLESEIPASRLAEPSEIAAAVAFLTGENSSYVHGHILHVNGAWYT